MSPRVPIACTLTSRDAVADRIDDWRQVVAAAVGREPIDGGLRLRFATDASTAADLARLAALEVGCCGWMDFALGVSADGTTLDVRAPDEGVDVLLSLFGPAS